ncbi:hypothetical protein H1R20_g8834, partial [Candolleomyces eurysporus]
MASTTPSKYSKALPHNLSNFCTPSPGLLTPPKTPVHPCRTNHVKANIDSKASKALLRLRKKLKERDAENTPRMKSSNGSLLSAAAISTTLPSQAPKKQKVDHNPNADDAAVLLAQDEVIEITSSDEEKSTPATAKDRTFHGQTTSSRVQPAKSAKPVSPLRTQGFWRCVGTSLEASQGLDVALDGNVEPQAAESNEELEMEPWDVISKGLKRKIVVDPESDDDSVGEYDSEDSSINNAAIEEDKNTIDIPSDKESRLPYVSVSEIRYFLPMTTSRMAMIHSVVSALAPNISDKCYNQVICDSAAKLFQTSARELKKKKKSKKTKSKGKGKKCAHDDDEAPTSSDDEVLTKQLSGPSAAVGASSGAVSANMLVSTIAPVPSTPALPVTMGALLANTATPTVPTTPGPGPALQALVPTTPANTAHPVTMAALVANTPGVASALPNVKYIKHVQKLLDTNKVDLPKLHDPILAADYPSLCNLLKGNIKPWTTTRGWPRFPISSYGRTVPNMNTTLALAILQFENVSSYINPSCISPLEVELREYPTNPVCYHVVCNSGAGMRQQFINWRGICLEWERWEAFFCMVTGHKHLAAQYGMNAIQASTKSDFTKGDSTMPIYTDEWTIDSNDKVPVYDARNAPAFDFVAHVSNIKNALPCWPAASSEIPHDSCVAVSYTVSLYLSGSTHEWTLGCNVRWVMVLGVPEGA